MKLVVLTPHFEPDLAPTGAVITKLVEGLAARGHRIEVITSLPWYRNHAVEPGYAGRLARREDTPWGHILRLHPLSTADKSNLLRRAVSFAGFTAVAAATGRRGGQADVVLAVSPPLTLGLAGAAIARARKAAFVFNIQDVFPDVMIELGLLTNPALVKAARALERRTYRHADRVTVLSDELRDNVAAKVSDPSKVRVIPNFVDTAFITPRDRQNPYRQELGLQDKTVVMYAGNVGLSQSLDLVIAAASAMQDDPGVAFVINGSGSARAGLQEQARGLANVFFVDTQPAEVLPDVLAAGDIHLVPLKAGLARASVPSKTFSILAAGRPFIASVDRDSEIARIGRDSGAGVWVPPGDAESLTKAIRHLCDYPEERHSMGAAGRSFVEGWASPAAVAARYEELFEELAG